ncbi:tripartite tricarboxylate transporter substrate binding protein [Bordetella petrii]|uniref:tripartite tricarboxylate transporter substrate binding protein n=1 Tax=Bordetella petrii TaxID=94624 RepID=UPI001A9633EE|nr:tripartite tricarboxylate transporter substrate binding protein [Bordetella petrii]MBO1114626.1 tripartite tricarboxylate transporter substrate binding protein [Bordetella petrii]
MKPVRFISATLAAAACAAATGALAAYPDKPIVLVVPFAPGGSTTVVARAVAERAEKLLGHPIIVENKPGAGSVVGSNVVAKAAPDGYTLLVGQTGFAVNASLRKNLPYDTLKDFTPIALLADHPGVFLAQAQKPYNTFKEFIAYAKAHPGKVTYSSAGVGSWPHLSMAMFANEAGLSLVHVPYQGTGPAKADLVAGRVDVKIEAYATSRAMVEDGRLKVLAVTSTQRAAELPDKPTIAESGYPDYETSYWIGVLGPAGVPPDIVAKLQQAFTAAAKDPAVAAQMRQQSIVPRGLPAADLDALLKKEIAKWREVIEDSHMEKQ